MPARTLDSDGSRWEDSTLIGEGKECQQDSKDVGLEGGGLENSTLIEEGKECQRDARPGRGWTVRSHVGARALGSEGSRLVYHTDGRRKGVFPLGFPTTQPYLSNCGEFLVSRSFPAPKQINLE